jgi:opacity protein-like surface antigen
MRHLRILGLVLAGIGTAASFAEAQEQRFHFSLGAGFTAPNSEVRDHLGDGYNINIGLQVDVTPVIAIEGVYSFNGLGNKRLSIPVVPLPTPQDSVPTDFFADMNMQYGTVNLIVQKPEGGARPYGLVGMGVYYRPVKVTTPGVGYVPGYCDPWWYICYPGGFVPVENIIGERSSTDFGMDFGGGVNFGKLYAEVRYHYIWGPTVQENQPVQPLPGADVSSERKANGQFLAFTFGVRF